MFHGAPAREIVGDELLDALGLGLGHVAKLGFGQRNVSLMRAQFSFDHP